MLVIPNELRMSKIYDAPRPLVWKVWTDPAHIAQWWGPFGPEHTTCEMDFRVGGEFRVLMKTPEGEVVPAAGAFLEIVAPERIVYEGDARAPTDCGCGLPPKARVEVLFEAVNNKTRIEIYTQFPDGDALDAANAAGFSASWTNALDAMGPYLQRLMENEQ
ncbi:SRPBCC family protein [Hyphococcus sp.]|uniref:SRPBCC family protein n=1 Tax=Hyphococcus sp. TaxID=2038636 RepID=UPI003CCC0E0B